MSVHRQPGETRRAYVERITSGRRGHGGLTPAERRLLWELQEAGREVYETFHGGPRWWQRQRRNRRRKVA